MTDEDSTETPGVYPAYDYGVHSNVKAVVSDDWGTTWSSPSVLVVSQAPQERFASWTGLCRLLDDGLLCVFTDGPWGEVSYETVKCTPSKLVDQLPIEDHLNHLNLEGTPFMWGLLGDWQTTTTANHGKVLKGACAATTENAKAFRGEISWTNYWIEADVRVEDLTAFAGICFRINEMAGLEPEPMEGAFYFCYLHPTASNQAEFRLRKYYHYSGYWYYEDLGQSFSTGFAPGQWRPIKVLAQGRTFHCFLDNVERLTFTDTSALPYDSGMIGLRAGGGSASFDNVKVLAVP